MGWGVFFDLLRGWERREQRQWALVREVLASIRNTTATKQSEVTTGRQLLPLPAIDGPPRDHRMPTPEEEAAIWAQFGLTPPTA